ncbi:MAG: GNAT family N-acetyltransferase [Chromatiales bacterium]|jgi:N-acetylglutamate synthase-like GNAT family acetyltransferase
MNSVIDGYKMQENTFIYRDAHSDDITGINRVVEAAVMGWNLPERVKRLSLFSYRYNDFDLQSQSIVVAETQQHEIVAVASTEDAEPADLPAEKTGLLLHGLYVLPEWQGHGIGRHLVQLALQQVRMRKLHGLLVKAQADAVGFFRTLGFEQLPVRDERRDYVNRYWLQSKAET